MLMGKLPIFTRRKRSMDMVVLNILMSSANLTTVKIMIMNTRLKKCIPMEKLRILMRQRRCMLMVRSVMLTWLRRITMLLSTAITTRKM